MIRSDVVQVAPAPRLSPLTQAEVVSWIRTRTTAQIRDLIAALELTLGVSAAPAVPRLEWPSNPPGIFEESANPPPPPVRLLEIGPERLLVLRAVRRLTGLSLRSSQALIDNLPAVVLEEPLDRQAALQVVADLEALGARASVG